ncbi:DUF1207 domain-containing protein [Ectothiorhodospiraceae bacterium 2226]|nr:DUF1207 domain-containing protein [Ectothiorhodospiraceae bacterium 2226]
MRSSLLNWIGIALLGWPLAAAAQGPSTEWLGVRLEALPIGEPYPPYLADPHRRALSLKWLGFDRVDIPDTGSSRLLVRAGMRFGLLRFTPVDRPDEAWQLSFEGGYDAQFDNDRRQDNIGWDGHYGLLLTTRRGPFAYKLGALHVSGHVGDEYMERVGRPRINYTREEWVAGIAWSPDPHWTAYAETGRAYHRGSPLLERWRAQAGVQVERRPPQWERLGWYAGLDLQGMEERDWRVDVALQVGLSIPSGHRLWRVGLELYEGRPPMTEFFEHTERYIALGAWLDI